MLVGGVWHFLPSAFHRGTQAWPVSGTLGVGLQLPGSSIPVPGDTDRLSWRFPAPPGPPVAHGCEVSGEAQRLISGGKLPAAHGESSSD